MSKPINITNAHRVAYLYLYFATETDQQLASEEMMVISAKVENFLNKNMDINKNLNSWDIVSETLNWFNSLSATDKTINYQKLIETLKENFNDEQKACFLNDLKELAKSDGIFLEAEKVLIDKSAKLLS